MRASGKSLQQYVADEVVVPVDKKLPQEFKVAQQLFIVSNCNCTTLIMTSLANQLKKLAVPQTSSLLQDFKRSSFLFDTKEATSIDRDTVYALGVNGLKELETLNKAFKTFHSSLFSESSKLMERSVHTQAVNQNLDKEIKKFLILLSPYFLLRPAHKALEWMIYRFHIEKYNIDDLLACIIPYHDTNYFVRVIQMLDLKSPTHRWNWLMPIQKPGVPLAKGTLFTHCYKDLGFLKFVCSLVSISLQVHALHHSSCGHTVINFYVTTVIGSLEVADKVREEYVSILYPFLSAGLKSENKDCIAATYMVLCQLVRKIQLDKDWLEKLLHLLILKIDDSLKKEAISCLCLVFQLQDIKIINKRLITDLSGITGLTEILSEISSKCSIDSFLKAYGKFLLENFFSSWNEDQQESKNKVFSVFKTVAMDTVISDLIKFLLQLFIDSSKKTSKDTKKRMQHKVAEAFHHIERKYPEKFDEAIKKFGHSEIVDEILIKISPDPNLHIHHANSRIRKQATKQLITLVEKNEVEDDSNICDILLARIDDDNPNIVKMVLNMKENILKVVDKSLLVEKISKLVLKNQYYKKKKWRKIVGLYRHMLLLVIDSSSDEKLICQSILSLIPLLYCCSQKDYTHLSEIYLQKFSDKTSILGNLKKENADLLKDKDDFPDQINTYNIRMIKCLKLWCKEIQFLRKRQILELLCESVQVSHDLSYHQSILFFLALCILPDLSHSSNSIEKIELVRLAFKFVDSLSSFKIIKLNVDVELSEALCSAFSSQISQKSLPYEGICYSILNMISSLEVPEKLKETRCWSTGLNDNDLSELYLLMMVEAFSATTKMHSTKSFTKEFCNFFSKVYKDHFGESSNILKFLLMLCNQIIQSDQLKFRQVDESVMNFSLELLRFTVSEEKDSSWLIESSCCVVPSMMTVLLSSCEAWRKAILDCMAEILRNKNNKGDLLYLNLISYLTEHREELINDDRCLPQLIQQFHEIKSNESPRKSKRVRKTNAVSAILELISDSSVGDDIKSSLLDCLSLINSSIILQDTNSYLSELTESTDMTILSSSKYRVALKLLHSSYTSNAVHLISNISCKEYTTFSSALKISESPSGLITMQKTALSLVNKDFFESISSLEIQSKLFAELLDLHITCRNSEITAMITHCLKKIQINSEIIVGELANFLEDSLQLKKFKEAKKVRR
ncbi:HEAT repeat-containing protein 1 [Nymphon striatum]|nr:HEAT repeat-containing protein 1 [Nymphon striatum]